MGGVHDLLEGLRIPKATVEQLEAGERWVLWEFAAILRCPCHLGLSAGFSHATSGVSELLSCNQWLSVQLERRLTMMSAYGLCVNQLTVQQLGVQPQRSGPAC